MKNKNTHTGKNPLVRSVKNRPLLYILIIVFVIFGIFFIYRSLAAGVTVFRDNPDYWRPRIAQCESGTFYGNKKNPKYRGAYQYSYSTWGNYKGYYDPADAPPEVQDERFYLSFAQAGTAPWSSSFKCWAKGAVVPSTIEDQISNVSSASSASTMPPPAPSPPPKPFGITSGSYNVIVNGRVTLNDAPLPGVVLNLCSADRTVTTDSEGRFSFGIPEGADFCVRPVSGIPEGAILSRIGNNVEQAEASTFEHQIAGVDCYKQFWCLLSPTYTWDRNRDSGYNFYYTKP